MNKNSFLKSQYGLLAILIFVCSIANAQTKLLTAAELKPFGRYAYSKKLGLEMISSAVHFGFSFEGDSCSIAASIPDVNGHNYLQYELDGKYQKRILVSGNSSKALVFRGSGAGRHKLWIYKATEAHTGPIFIKEVRGRDLKPILPTKAPLIEFIGNSITCGAAADASEVQCGAGVYHDQHNAYMAYGPRLARALHVNFILSSVSGIGIYRNWNSDSPVMPKVYEKTDFQELSKRLWNFKLYSPTIVSIALGTNDFSNGDGKTPRKPFDADEFTSRYVDFVKLVKSKYPKARIALLSSPMVKGESARILERCLITVKKQIGLAYPLDKPIATFFFPAMEARGCSGHPSVADHLILSQQLDPFFKTLLATN
jgi:lysophospholipase L1-like esterase